MFTTRLKRLLYPLYIYPKVSKQQQKKLQQLFDYYRNKAVNNEPVHYTSAGLKLFSNMEEDGIILWLTASLNIANGIFIDIGSNDCINSNCANLVFNFNWQGTFIDGNSRLLKIGERNYKLFGNSKKQNLRFVKSFLTADNINSVMDKNKISAEIDFMSIDIDGNDYAIWQALNCVQPKIVLIENKVEYGNYDIVIPANNHFLPEEWGASPASITKLAAKKGYTLVAANCKGFNTFYLRNDLVSPVIPPLEITTLLNQQSVKQDFFDEATMIALQNKSRLQRK